MGLGWHPASFLLSSDRKVKENALLSQEHPPRKRLNSCRHKAGDCPLLSFLGMPRFRPCCPRGFLPLQVLSFSDPTEERRGEGGKASDLLLRSNHDL